MWGGATLGTSLRLLLGFDGPANIDPDMAKRGKAFAENLIQQKTFADAWIQAVNSTSQSNKPVAIGIGNIDDICFLRSEYRQSHEHARTTTGRPSCFL